MHYKAMLSFYFVMDFLNNRRCIPDDDVNGGNVAKEPYKKDDGVNYTQEEMGGRSGWLEFQPVAGYIQQVLFIKESVCFPLFHLVNFFKMLEGFLGAAILGPSIIIRAYI